MKNDFLLKRSGKTYLITDTILEDRGHLRSNLNSELYKQIYKENDEYLKPYFESIQKELQEFKRKVLVEGLKVAYFEDKVTQRNSCEYAKWKAEVHKLKNTIHLKGLKGEDFSAEELALHELNSSEPVDKKDEYIALSKEVSEMRKLRPYEIINSYLDKIRPMSLTKAERTEVAKVVADDYEMFKKYYAYRAIDIVNFIWGNDELFFEFLEKYCTFKEVNILEF